MKMLGKTNHAGCGCCQDTDKVRQRRLNKRRERQAWRKALTNDR